MPTSSMMADADATLITSCSRIMSCEKNVDLNTCCSLKSESLLRCLVVWHKAHRFPLQSRSPEVTE